ncbi:uncharacterized protein LOC122504207 [Leptopilina heterotoma]|uniref:uncharacterized protein LOC122504207 n=1 Tax=Leptopilina heterotoma TaxID=63436 RepID=UPI001CAA2FF3|nr:uncharacterized protein LOC122504207 [Leptopilina heterotoma]
MDSIEIVEKQFVIPKQERISKVDEKMHTKGKVGKLFARIKRQCNEILQDPELQEYMKKAVEFSKANPFFTCGLFALMVGIAFPIIIFVLFVIANVAFVIAGFIILEVTIFIIGATVMSCSLFFVTTAVAIIGLSILTFYLLFHYLVNLMKKRKV